MNKKQQQILNSTLDKAISPPQRMNREKLDELLNEYDTPIESVAPKSSQSSFLPPPVMDDQNVSPKSDDQAEHLELGYSVAKLPSSSATEKLSYSSLATEKLSYSVAKSETTPQPPATLEQGLQNTNSQSAFYQVFNVVDDEIMPTLTLAEQSVFRRLYRLSYGFNRQITDSVSLNRLAEKCNLSLAGVKLAIKSLQMKNLIKIVGDRSRDPRGGNKYEIRLDGFLNKAAEQLGYSVAKLVSSPIKDDDDFNNTSNHHQKAVMTIYQQVTGNTWTPADAKTYQQIKATPLEVIESAIRIATNRAASQPRSLAYFKQEIIQQQQPKKETKATTKNKLKRIVGDVRNIYVGTHLSFSELAELVKDRAAKEGIPYGGGILDEVLNELL